MNDSYFPSHLRSLQIGDRVESHGLVEGDFVSSILKGSMSLCQTLPINKWAAVTHHIMDAGNSKELHAITHARKWLIKTCKDTPTVVTRRLHQNSLGSLTGQPLVISISLGRTSIQHVLHILSTFWMGPMKVLIRSSSHLWRLLLSNTIKWAHIVLGSLPVPRKMCCVTSNTRYTVFTTNTCACHR